LWQAASLATVQRTKVLILSVLLATESACNFDDMAPRHQRGLALKHEKI
jgi:hypothetical protein